MIWRIDENNRTTCLNCDLPDCIHVQNNVTALVNRKLCPIPAGVEKTAGKIQINISMDAVKDRDILDYLKQSPSRGKSKAIRRLLRVGIAALASGQSEPIR